MKKMSDKEREQALQAYTERIKLDAPGTGGNGSEEEGEGGGRDSSSSEEERVPRHHYENIHCSAGSVCVNPESATFAALCKHRNPRHFECADLPCEDGCGDDDSSVTSGDEKDDKGEVEDGNGQENAGDEEEEEGKEDGGGRGGEAQEQVQGEAEKLPRPTQKGKEKGGAICFVGEVYPGGMSDVEVVKADKVVDKMKEAGLANNGCQLMADRGFNSMSPSLIRAGIHFVAPPWKRRTEVQFTAADMDVTREVANLRIHVERAIGALKTWRIVEHKFNHKQYDHITMCFRVVAALVNMTQQPFSSDK
eukprot:g10315.t1